MKEKNCNHCAFSVYSGGFRYCRSRGHPWAYVGEFYAGGTDNTCEEFLRKGLDEIVFRTFGDINGEE